MKQEEYKTAANFWKNKECKTMPVERLKPVVEEYLRTSSICALATGYGTHVRCTPLEYSYHDGKFWIFTEGGEKFIGLEKNDRISLAVFDPKPGFGELKSVQITGRVSVIEPMSEEYVAHARNKKIPISALEKLAAQGHPMYLLCIEPERADVLFSDLKKMGYDSRQVLDFAENKKS